MPDNLPPVGANQRQTLDPLGGPITGGQYHDLSQDLIDRLHDAALNLDNSKCDAAITFGLSKGIGAEKIADLYIPAVARIMGDKWCEDQLSFAYVTIGVSRLQSMLRILGPNWADDSGIGVDAPTILLVVGHDCHHTLGAMVLAGQLRRRGISVQLLLDATPRLVKARLQQSPPDAVFISASYGESLDSLKRIVDSTANVSKAVCKVVIGGTILTTTPDILALTGADYASNDPDEAIALCALNKRTLRRPSPIRGR